MRNNGPDQLAGVYSVSVTSEECSNCFTDVQHSGSVPTLVGDSNNFNVSFIVPSVPGQYFPSVSVRIAGSQATKMFGIEVYISTMHTILSALKLKARILIGSHFKFSI